MNRDSKNYKGPRVSHYVKKKLVYSKNERNVQRASMKNWMTNDTADAESLT